MVLVILKKKKKANSDTFFLGMVPDVSNIMCCFQFTLIIMVTEQKRELIGLVF